MNAFVRISAALAVLALPAVGGAVPDAGTGKIDPRVERSVEKGLEYLAKSQREDGSWPGSYGRSAGVAGLCALAFLAHGEEPGVGDYGKTIERAVKYILSCQDSRGVLSGGISPMYSHGFATLALAEVYGMSRDKDVGKGLKKAVDLIVKAQNGEGGWRYSIGSPSSDITVTGCQMMALRAAQNAGIEVPKKAIDKGVRYVKSCAVADGGFSYQAGRFSGSGVARTGIGVAVLSLCGEYNSDQAKRGAEYLRYKPLERENYFYYGAYYCSQAMFQAGGSYWRDWNKQVSRAILDRQSADGSWPGATGGVECCTAMALLALEVRWRLLPIYQR